MKIISYQISFFFWNYVFTFIHFPCQQGEEQKKLDVLSNEVFIKALVSSGRTVSCYLIIQMTRQKYLVTYSNSWQIGGSVFLFLKKMKSQHMSSHLGVEGLFSILDDFCLMLTIIISINSSYFVLILMLFLLIFQWQRYSVVFDPLDGSSNIDCGVSIGTVTSLCYLLNEISNIFGIISFQ